MQCVEMEEGMIPTLVSSLDNSCCFEDISLKAQSHQTSVPLHWSSTDQVPHTVWVIESLVIPEVSTVILTSVGNVHDSNPRHFISRYHTSNLQTIVSQRNGEHT